MLELFLRKNAILFSHILRVFNSVKGSGRVFVSLYGAFTAIAIRDLSNKTLHNLSIGIIYICAF